MTQIHPRLENDCLLLGRFPLCWLLLSRDARYPWFILVPARDDITEMFQLDATDQQQLMIESCHLGQRLASTFKADKMNIAALGNVVEQLHVHHIVRYRHDSAWPDPVWGKFPAIAYSSRQLQQVHDKILAMDLEDFELIMQL